MAIPETHTIEIDGLTFQSLEEAKYEASMGFVDQTKVDEFEKVAQTLQKSPSKIAELFKKIIPH